MVNKFLFTCLFAAILIANAFSNDDVGIPLKLGAEKAEFLENKIYQSPEEFDIDTNIIGQQQIYKIKKGDNLFVIARSNKLSVAEVILANPQIHNPKIIYFGQDLILPLSHILPNVNTEGVVINLAELRLYYFLPDNSTVLTVPIAIGAEGYDTPIGKTKIIRKRKNPYWIPPARLREENPYLPEVIPAGINNPLGRYALDLSWPRFLIHGTNDPRSIGNKESHGCIRLYPEDIEELFGLIEVGTKVNIINQPIKIGWINNNIYIESHLPREQTQDIDNTKKIICRKVKDCDVKIDWQKVVDVISKNNGIPTQVGSL
jgi:L,D-transpeptidase ErfK/SrfK